MGKCSPHGVAEQSWGRVARQSEEKRNGLRMMCISTYSAAWTQPITEQPAAKCWRKFWRSPFCQALPWKCGELWIVGRSGVSQERSSEPRHLGSGYLATSTGVFQF